MDWPFLLDSGNILLKAFQAAKYESPVLTSLIVVATKVVDSI